MKDLSQRSLCTLQSLKNDFRNLGLTPGSTIIIHASLSSLGYIVGGAETVITALLNTVTDTGTLVVPTQTSDNSDPSMWSNPPVPQAWWQPIRDSTPAYNPKITPTIGMGKIAETLRTWPGALRSVHPQTSFAALGDKADYITKDHALDSALGENSPLVKLEELNAQVLLIGTGFDKCTAFHLAEYRLGRPKIDGSFAVMTEKGRVWMTVQDADLDEEPFGDMGNEYEKIYPDRIWQGKVGDAQCRLFSLPDAVNFAESWLKVKDSTKTNGVHD